MTPVDSKQYLSPRVLPSKLMALQKNKGTFHFGKVGTNLGIDSLLQRPLKLFGAVPLHGGSTLIYVLPNPPPH